MNALHTCIEYIHNDESRDMIVLQWENLRTHSHKPFEFEILTSVIAQDLGQDAIDVEQFVKKYYDSWKKRLTMLNTDYKFEVEARKLIEYSLLFEYKPSPPVTGEDIKAELDVIEGPKLGELIKTAYQLFDNGYRTRESIIEKLKEYV